MSEHVLIVGGGIAGLALAAALDPSRVRVTLVEERPERAGAGTVLALWRSGRRALDALCVGEQVRATALPVRHGALRTASGGVLHQGRVPTLWFAPRPDLIAALVSRLPATVTHLTQQVTQPHELADELGADLIVGADGVRSACRQQAFAGSAPVVTQWIALRGHLPVPSALDAATEWWGPDGIVGRTPGPQGAAWFCALRHPGEVRDTEPILTAAREHFSTWDPAAARVITEGVARADAQRILTAPPMRRIVQGHLVLIGDAAHGMTPNLGRGANEALHDAHLLADLIHRYGTKGALTPFARRRHLPGQVLRAGASIAMRVATAPRLATLSDRALRPASRSR